MAHSSSGRKSRNLFRENAASKPAWVAKFLHSLKMVWPILLNGRKAKDLSFDNIASKPIWVAAWYKFNLDTRDHIIWRIYIGGLKYLTKCYLYTFISMLIPNDCSLAS